MRMFGSVRRGGDKSQLPEGGSSSIHVSGGVGVAGGLDKSYKK